MKTQRAKACDISIKVRQAVYERDEGMCIICRRPGIPNAHYIPRSSGGLGVEQNVVTLCEDCHDRYDHTLERPELGEKIREYLENIYLDWVEDDLIYKNALRCGR